MLLVVLYQTKGRDDETMSDTPVDALLFVRDGTAPLTGRPRSHTFDQLTKLSILHPDFSLGQVIGLLWRLFGKLMWWLGLPGGQFVP